MQALIRTTYISLHYNTELFRKNGGYVKSLTYVQNETDFGS